MHWKKWMKTKILVKSRNDQDIPNFNECFQFGCVIHFKVFLLSPLFVFFFLFRHKILSLLVSLSSSSSNNFFFFLFYFNISENVFNTLCLFPFELRFLSSIHLFCSFLLIALGSFITFWFSFTDYTCSIQMHIQSKGIYFCMCVCMSVCLISNDSFRQCHYSIGMENRINCTAHSAHINHYQRNYSNNANKEQNENGGKKKKNKNKKKKKNSAKESYNNFGATFHCGNNLNFLTNAQYSFIFSCVRCFFFSSCSSSSSSLHPFLKSEFWN